MSATAAAREHDGRVEDTSDTDSSVADEASAANTEANDAYDADPPHVSAFQTADSTEVEVTAEDAAETRASDAAVAAEDARAGRQAEQRDVQSGTMNPPGVNPAQALRQPPIPDDSADGSVAIRFKHPE